MDRVLVTGGAGYIGSMVVEHLRKEGKKVTSLDSMGQGGRQDGDCVQTDYRQMTKDDFYQCFDWIVHLAGHSSVGMCRTDPVGAFHNNVAGFIDLLKACRGRKLIYASSVSVYGNIPDSGNFHATEIWNLPTPQNHYDANKQDCDRYAALFGGDTWGLRFGTVCGWSHNLREDLLLNSMTMSAARDKVVRLANPKTNRPILGINDLCRAVSHVVNGKVAAGVYNLVTKNVTMEEMAEEVACVCHARIETVEMQNAYNILASNDKFRSQNGFEFNDWVPELIKRVWFGSQQCLRTARRDGGWITGK